MNAGSDDYLAPAEDMCEQTDHLFAPRTIISGEQKHWARVQMIETVVARMEMALEEFEHPDWGEDIYL